MSAGRFLLDRRNTGAIVIDVGLNPCPTITGAAFGRHVWTVTAPPREGPDTRPPAGTPARYAKPPKEMFDETLDGC